MGAEIVLPCPETIAKLCLEKYKKQPRTGKPSASQWTVLAGIVLHDALEDSCKVVSLGLGTKCIGVSKMCRSGLIVNDSHAEVLARRGLLRYLYHQFKETSCESATTSNTITTWDAKERVYRLKPQISFHFFSSQSPCGDACIVDKNISNEDIIPPKRQKFMDESNGNKNGIFTGAKLFANDPSKGSGDRMAQTLGALRIKPGKGDRTSSMSCSDKLSKWCYLGVQGAMINVLLADPIYLSSMTFYASSDIDALHRALNERWKDYTFEYGHFRERKPHIQICNDKSLLFECTQNDIRNQPSPSGLVWCDVPEIKRSYEVVVNGKRQGCTKKIINTPEGSLKISKFGLLCDFIDVLKENTDILLRCGFNEESLVTLKYCDAKALASSYQNAWTSLKDNVFRLWTEKSEDLLKFSLSSVDENAILNLKKS